MNQLDFSGRTAAITGGAMGIGLAVARRLAAGGARIALWDRDAAALAAARTALGGDTQVFQLDVADAAAVERVAQATAAAFGGIDVLVCSAGITGPNVPLADYPVDEW
jgi:3-oxoacyl-[acyl-carrier protein] reductase